MLSSPTFKELSDKFNAKFLEKKPTVDPTIRGSWVDAIGKSIASLAVSIAVLIEEVQKEFNPITAVRTIGLWGSYEGLSQLGASSSIGVVRAYGVFGAIVPANEQWVGDSNSIIYTNNSQTTIETQDTDSPPVSVRTLTRSGTLVTALCYFPHSLVTGTWVKMSGAVQAGYNGTYVVTANPLNIYEFTYTITTAPITPATGAPFTATPIIKIDSISELNGTVTVVTYAPHNLADGQNVLVTEVSLTEYTGEHTITVIDDHTFTYDAPVSPLAVPTVKGVLYSIHANLSVVSTTTGSNTTLPPNDLLTYQGSATDVYSFAKTIEGLQGGAEIEDIETFRARILLSRTKKEGVFTNDDIELASKTINGNTRIFIQNPDSNSMTDQNPVLAGQVRVYVIRDNDPLGKVPTGSILVLTKQIIIQDAKLPASMWEKDLQVLPPVLVPINVVINNMRPNTTSMQNAIKTQLSAYFGDDIAFGQNVDNDILRGVVSQTQDLTAGTPEESFIKSFDWVNVVEVVPKEGLPTLGTVTVNGMVI